MPFTWDGQGLHDASWRSSFGGSIYSYNGSHGCVNLPVSFASQLYEEAKTGTPVICTIYGVHLFLSFFLLLAGL